MIITVRRIDITQMPEHEHGLYSYWIEFESTLTSGQALLYSHTTPEKLLSERGIRVETPPANFTGFRAVSARQISVETSQDRITDFHVLSEKDRPNAGRLTPLTTLCDYEVTGRVVFLAQEVFDVEVDPGWCSFTIGFDEITPITVNEGDWVTFKLLGLALWDEHL